jgi:hypothetical protein
MRTAIGIFSLAAGGAIYAMMGSRLRPTHRWERTLAAVCVAGGTGVVLTILAQVGR